MFIHCDVQVRISPLEYYTQNHTQTESGCVDVIGPVDVEWYSIFIWSHRENNLFRNGITRMNVQCTALHNTYRYYIAWISVRDILDKKDYWYLDSPFLYFFPVSHYFFFVAYRPTFNHTRTFISVKFFFPFRIIRCKSWIQLCKNKFISPYIVDDSKQRSF